MTPTQRTLKALRDRGMTCGIVEKFNRFAGPHGIRQDLFGFIDIIAISADRGIVGVQSCGQDFAAHYRKITEEKAAEALEWLSAGGKIELWGWRKVKEKRGGKRMVWKPRTVVITEEDIGGGNVD